MKDIEPYLKPKNQHVLLYDNKLGNYFNELPQWHRNMLVNLGSIDGKDNRYHNIERIRRSSLKIKEGEDDSDIWWSISGFGRLLPRERLSVDDVSYMVFPFSEFIYEKQMLYTNLRNFVEKERIEQKNGIYITGCDIEITLSILQEMAIKGGYGYDVFIAAEIWDRYLKIYTEKLQKKILRVFECSPFNSSNVTPDTHSEENDTKVSLHSSPSTRRMMQIQAVKRVIENNRSNPDIKRRTIYIECQKIYPELFSIGWEAFRKIWRDTHREG